VGQEKMMNKGQNKVLFFMTFILTTIYVGCYFLPSHWGVKCSDTSAPLGSMLLGIFYGLWTIFVVHTIRSDPMLALEKESLKSLGLKAFDLMKDHTGKIEYDHGRMVLAQR
jgi:hypothetical protein